MPQVHNPAAGQTAHGRDSQSNDTQDQQNDHGGVQDGGSLTQNAQQQAQEDGGEVADAPSDPPSEGQFPRSDTRPDADPGYPWGGADRGHRGSLP